MRSHESPDPPLTAENLRDLDVRRGKASIEWYPAKRARHRDENAAEASQWTRRRQLVALLNVPFRQPVINHVRDS